MDPVLVLHNGSLLMVEHMLVADESLAHGAVAYRIAEGTDVERLTEAIKAMIARLKRPVEYISFDGPLEDYTVPQLRQTAEQYGVSVYSSDRKADIIRKLRGEQRKRLEFS